MGRRAFVLVALSASALAACDALPEVQSGTCGNKVVDPNEDCDTFAPVGALCRSPGTTAQCRFACGAQSDGTTATCPPGMGCGVDGTCRAPTGVYTQTAQLIEGNFSDVYTGDVDGDGRADVVGLDPNVISTSFFDVALATKTTIDTRRRANVKVHPLVRDLSGDGRADLVVVRGNGTLVELGSQDRTFAPLAFPSSYLANLTNAQLIAFDAPPPNVGDTLLLMGTFKSLSGILSADPTTGQGAPFYFLPSPKTPADLAGPVVTGHVIEDKLVSPCGELSFAFTGASEVDVFTACISNGSGGYKFNDYVSTSTPIVLPLPASTPVVRGPLLIDANDDGHLDLLVGATKSCTGCDEIDVAYGAGDGNFAAFAPYALALMPNAKPGPLPLALGDLNGDGILDHVTSTFVLVSQKSGGFVAQAEGHGAPWTQAVIGDFNHDGIIDVAAGSSSAPNIDFYLGAGGGTLDPFVIPSAPSTLFAVGDFDGDLVNDLALAELAEASDPLGDSVSILFGNAFGAPSPPISMGRFTTLTQTIAGRFVDPFGILSATDGLLTTEQLPGGTAFGSFAGSGDRALRSPFVMNIVDTQAGTATSAQPLRYALGHFTSQSSLQLGAIDDQFAPPPTSPVHHSWLLELDAQGRVDMTTTRHGDVLPDGLDWYSAALVAVDLDGSGADQLVALGPSSSDATRGTTAIAKVGPTSTSDPTPALIFGAPSPMPAVLAHVESDDPGAQSGRVVAADLDGDGRPDIVAVATIAGTTSVVVFWNDHTGGLGPITAIPNPNGHAAIDFAIVNAGATGPSLAVLTDEGVTLASFSSRTPNASALAFHVGDGHRVATGDVDGDGVEDLVVASDAGISVFRGKPVKP